jgi:hypothetical protein
VQPDSSRATSASIPRIPRVLWLSPATPPERSAELVARAPEDKVDIVPKELEVWGDARLESYTLIEPATIGDDDWSDGEADWRARMQAIFELPPADRNIAFRRARMDPNEPVPPPPAPSSGSSEQALILEHELATTGFRSSDWATLTQPVLVVTGGRSHPRFGEVSARLCEVVPNAFAATFPSVSHLQSSERHDPERLSALLVDPWSRVSMAIELSPTAATNFPTNRLSDLWCVS